MKRKVVIISFILFLIVAFTGNDAFGQCAMCKAIAEDGVKGGNTTSRTLNSGILYLLAMPYLSFSVIGFLWWKNYKKKKLQDERDGVSE